MDKTWEEACRGCPIAIVLDPHGHSYDEPHHAEEAQLRKQEAHQTEREERLAPLTATFLKLSVDRQPTPEMLEGCSREAP